MYSQQQGSPASDIGQEVDEELMAIFKQSAANYHAALNTALDNSEWEALRKTAHTVKGSAGSFGFTLIAQKAETLQLAIDGEQFDTVPQLALDLIAALGKIL